VGVVARGRGSMLFDLRPKESRSDLYDREDVLEGLERSLSRGDPLILVLGLRRYGKTSVLKVFLNECKCPFVYLDCRDIFLVEYPRIEDVASIFSRSIRRLLDRYRGLSSKIKSFVRDIEELSTPVVSLRFREKVTRFSYSLFELIDCLDEWACSRGLRAILAFDEAQYLGKVIGVDFRKFFARIYDNNRNITVVLTGSEIGLLQEFLRVEDSSSPLYGRYVKEIVLKPFTYEQSVDFLEKGFSEMKISIPHTIVREIVARVDGVVGWLTYYGKMVSEYYLQGVNVGLRELDEVQRKAQNLALEELRKLLSFRRSRRYFTILKTIALLGSATWSQVKRGVELYEGRRVSDPTITDLLKTLLKLSIIAKDSENRYYIIDPVLKKALLDAFT